MRPHLLIDSNVELIPFGVRKKSKDDNTVSCCQIPWFSLALVWNELGPFLIKIIAKLSYSMPICIQIKRPLSTLEWSNPLKARNLARLFSQNEHAQDITTEFWQLLKKCSIHRYEISLNWNTNQIPRAFGWDFHQFVRIDWLLSVDMLN